MTFWFWFVPIITSDYTFRRKCPKTRCHVLWSCCVGPLFVVCQPHRSIVKHTHRDIRNSNLNAKILFSLQMQIACKIGAQKNACGDHRCRCVCLKRRRDTAGDLCATRRRHHRPNIKQCALAGTHFDGECVLSVRYSEKPTVVVFDVLLLMGLRFCKRIFVFRRWINFRFNIKIQTHFLSARLLNGMFSGAMCTNRQQMLANYYMLKKQQQQHHSASSTYTLAVSSALCKQYLYPTPDARSVVIQIFVL